MTDQTRFQIHQTLPGASRQGISAQIQHESQESVKNIKDGFSLALQTADLSRAASFYLRSIKLHVSSRYYLSENDSNDITQLVYSLIVNQEIDLALRAKACDTLRKLLKFYPITISLPWRPLYDVLIQSHFKLESWKAISTSKYHIFRFLRLIKFARRHFDSVEIIEVVRPMLCAQDRSAIQAAALLQLFLPVPPSNFAYQQSLEYFLNVWSWIENSNTWDRIWFAIFQRILKGIAKHKISLPPNISSELMKVFLTRMNYQLDISVIGTGSGSIPKIRDAVSEAETEILAPMNSESYYFAKAIVYLLNEDNYRDILTTLQQFFHSVHTLYHPSNTGSWTGHLIKLMRNFSKHYASRISQGSSIVSSSECKRLFIRCFNEILLYAIYSKDRDSMSKARETLLFLLHIDREEVLQNVELNIVENLGNAFSNLTAAHQSDSACEVLGNIIGDLVCDIENGGEQNAVNFMSLLLQHIDHNNMNKTKAVFKAIFRFLSFVPLHSSPIGNNQFFEDWSLTFIDRVLHSLMVNKDKEEKRDQENWWKFLQKITYNAFFAQLGDQLYDTIVNKVAEFALDNNLPNAKSEMGYLYKGACKKNPEKFLAKVLPLHFKVLVQLPKTGPARLADRSDDQLVWNLLLVSYAVKKSQSACLQTSHKDQIQTLIRFATESKTTKIFKAGCKLLYSVIFSTSRCYPVNYSSLGGKKSGITWNSNVEYKDVDMTWHIPNQTEVDFARTLASEYLNVVFTKLASLFSQPLSNENKDDIIRYVNLAKWILRVGTRAVPKGDTAMDENQPWKLHSITIPHSEPLILDQNHVDQTENMLSAFHQFIKNSGNTKFYSILIKLIEVYLLHNTVKPSSVRKRHLSVKAISDKYRNYTTKSRHVGARAIQVERSYVYYLHRVSESTNYGIELNASNKKLFLALYELAISDYTEVRKESQRVLTSAFKHYPQSLKFVLVQQNDIVSILQTVQDNDAWVKGVVSLLNTQNVLRKFLSEWDLRSSLLIALARSFVHQKAELQFHLHQLYLSIGVKYFPIPLIQPIIQLPDHLKFIKEAYLVQRGLDIKQKKDEKNVQLLLATVRELLAISENSGNLHWRYELMIYLCLILLSSDERNLIEISKREFGLTVDLVKKLYLGLISPLQSTRRVVLKGSSVILKLLNSFTKSASSTTHKHYAGWNGNPVPVVKKEQPFLLSQEQQNQLQHLFLEISDKNMQTVLKYILQDHQKSESTGGQAIQFGGMKLPGNIGAMIGKFLGGGGASSRSVHMEMDEEISNILMRKIIESTRIYPSSFRFPVLDANFNSNAADFWKFLFRFCGVRILPTLFDQVNKTLFEENNVESSSTLSEIVAGLIKGSTKGFDENSVKDFWRAVLPIIEKSWNQLTPQLVSEWTAAIGYFARNTEVAMLKPISDILFSDLISPSNTSSVQTRKLLLAVAYLMEVQWRNQSMNELVLNILASSLAFPTKQVRHVIGEAISVIFTNLWVPGRSDSRLENFIKSTRQHILGASEEDRTRITETLLHLLHYTVSRGDSQVLLSYFVPTIGLQHLLELQMLSNPDEDLVKLARTDLALLSQAHVGNQAILEEIVSQALQVVAHPSLTVRKAVLPFIQFVLSDKNKKDIQQLVVNLLQDSHIEVRDIAKNTLTSLAASLTASDIQNLISQFDQLRRTGVSQSTRGRPIFSTDPDSVTKRHGAVLGLCALAESNPYAVPAFLPELLMKIAEHRADTNIIQNSVKYTFGEFWRTHQDEWNSKFHVLFNEDQLGVLNDMKYSQAYYA